MKTFAILPALLLAFPALARSEAPGDPLFSPDGYRIAHYRGPVPAAPPGVRRITPAEVVRLGPRAVLIDVMPAEGGFRGEDGVWHLAAARPSLPGAHWFPEAGRGVPAPGIAVWFAKGAARLTRGNRHRTLVTFCLADCWMSWNAARRLRAMGYTDVRWLAEGTDGWREAGLPLVEARPEGE